ncbi:MAG: hypothetical protein H3C39_05150 [Flavobacteriia bacterium]|nr:hypothetical protein [Flavobacteriia bacterium]
MDEKTMGIVSYLTLIGWIIVLATRKEKTEYTSFHLRQNAGLILLSLAIYIVVLILIFVLPFIGLVANILYLGLLVLWLIGLLGAINNEKKPVPIFGSMFQDWFKTMF